MKNIPNFKSFLRAEKHFVFNSHDGRRFGGSENTRKLHSRARIQIHSVIDPKFQLILTAILKPIKREYSCYFFKNLGIIFKFSRTSESIIKKIILRWMFRIHVFQTSGYNYWAPFYLGAVHFSCEKW